MKTRIGLIRHGETVWNRTGRWQGHAPTPISDEGRQQAALLAEYLAQRGEPVAAIYSSDSPRCRETAAIVAGRLGKPLSLDKRLREIDLGEWQGLTSDEIRAWDGERFAAAQLDPYNISRPGGENLSQVAERALQVIREAVERHPGEYCLVVSHGGTIRSVLYWLKLTGDSHVSVGNTALTLLSYEPELARWNLDALGLMDHLKARSVVPGDNES
jgi:broad specificity phosphatase PhoE